MTAPEQDALPPRPTATTFSISRLMSSVAAGVVRVPKFQRAFRWDDEDRRLLFDSIANGYPIGTVLLWRRRLAADVVTLGGYTALAPATDDALEIVDGQQRIATLATALLAESGGLRPIFFDLRAGEFVLGRRDRQAPEHYLPTARLLSSSALLAWLRRAELDDSLITSADSIAARVREYEVPAYLISATREETARRVFARTNNTGRKLDQAEVFDAIHGESALTLGGVAMGLRTLGLGALDPKLVELSALLVGKKDPGQPLQRQVHDADVPALLEATAAAMSRALEFLSGDASVVHLELLPYAGVLPLLALFFARFPDPHPRTRELLVRWLWRGAVHGSHRRDLLGMRASIRAIGHDEHASIRGLLSQVPSERARVAVEARFNARHAHARITLLAMAACEPRSLTPPHEPVSLRLAFERVVDDRAHPPVVRLVDDKSSVPGRELVSARLLSEPLAPRAVRERLAAATDESVLRSHLVTREAHEALRAGDIAALVSRRLTTIDEHVCRFVAERATWDPRDRDVPALDSFFENAAQ